MMYSVMCVHSLKARLVVTITDFDLFWAIRIVGTFVPRLEGRDKVTGQARYVDDMIFAEHAARCDSAQPDSARKG